MSDHDTDVRPEEPIVSVAGVSVSYGSAAKRAVVVSDVSLEIRPGEFIGLVGESGSGKSTLVRAILGLLPVSEGRIAIGGRSWTDLRGRERRAVRSTLQTVFQDPHGAFDPRQRVGAGLREMRALHGAATEWIDDAGLLRLVHLAPDILRRYPHQLSGGQAQRVAIARAILPQPKAIIADEATSSLDVSVQAQVIAVLNDLRDRLGLAILLVSHDLALVRQTCERILVLQHGREVESGLTEDVLRDPSSAYTRALVDAIPRLPEAGIRERSDR